MPPADTPQPDEHLVPANDNRAADGPASEALGKADVVLQIARLIGHRMTRKDFAALTAANDND